MFKARNLNDLSSDNDRFQPTGTIKRLCVRFLNIRGSPREIAYGFALGLFIGMSPFMMIHTISAIAVAWLFKWNKIAAVIGVAITNPITAPFLYWLTYSVGLKALSIDGSVQFPKLINLETLFQLIQNAPEILWILTIGGIIMGAPISIAGYWMAYWSVLKYRSLKASRRL